MPATIFAVNRTAKAKGRIIFLINSIITIKGVKINGEPIGTRCLIDVKGELIKLYKRCPIHKGSPIETQIDK